MKASFEEKSYESYFNTELASLTDIYFPLGQVQEGSLGFDASAMTRNRRLWRALGHPFWFFPHFGGVSLLEIAEDMEHFLGVALDNMPDMKANLLFQYKRPEFITKSSGAEWNHWNQPYYRYDIFREQHDLLMRIDASFGLQDFIVYAAPALINVNELVDAYIKRQIINLSNFRKASELSGHHRNTYTREGRYSICCSEPERSENFDLIKELNKLEISGEISDNYNRNFIKNVSNHISGIMSEHRDYAKAYLKLRDHYSKFEQYNLLYSHLLMKNFSQLTGMQWLVKI